jgi:2-methylfumaryl-CoA isomerase
MNLGFLDMRVIESSAFIAAPLAGLTLAQFGADVIRVDMIGGGLDYGRLPLMPSGRSLYWTGLNKGKRSLAVDLRNPEGRELVATLVTADGERGGILLTNIMTPWLAHDVLAKRRADVITCGIEGNPDGTTALDYTVNCATGFPAITGNGGESEPVNHVLPAWDMACAYQAAFSVVAAVARRTRTGRGANLRMALADVAFTMLAHNGMSVEAELLQSDRPAIGNHIYGAFGRDFQTSDDKRVMIAAISIGQWTSLIKTCGLEGEIAALEKRGNCDFKLEADRYEARETIAQLLEPWFLARTLAQVERAFKSGGVCWGLYRTTRDLITNDPRVNLGNPVWETIATAGVGQHRTAGTPVRADGEPRGGTIPAPLLGQHTDEILLEVLGLDSAAVGRLHDAGVIAGPERDPTRMK